MAFKKIELWVNNEIYSEDNFEGKTSLYIDKKIKEYKSLCRNKYSIRNKKFELVLIANSLANKYYNFDNRKINEKQIVEIYNKRNRGYTIKELASFYKVSTYTIKKNLSKYINSNE